MRHQVRSSVDSSEYVSASLLSLAKHYPGDRTSQKLNLSRYLYLAEAGIIYVVCSLPRGLASSSIFNLAPCVCCYHQNGLFVVNSPLCHQVTSEVRPEGMAEIYLAEVSPFPVVSKREGQRPIPVHCAGITEVFHEIIVGALVPLRLTADGIPRST